MKSITAYNNFHGKTVSRKKLEKVLVLAIKDKQKQIIENITAVLDNYSDATFAINLKNKIAIPALAAPNVLSAPIDPDEFAKLGIPFMENQDDNDDEAHGLGKAVTSTQIYDMITKKIIEAIQGKTNFVWRKPWKSEEYGITATNYVSKEAYRGINAVLLNMFNNDRSPYWLTFKQVQRLKGKVKEGTHGDEVIYYSNIYKITQEQPKISFSTPDEKKYNAFLKANANKINGTAKKDRIPVLRYYIVHNADDVEGVKFKMPVFKKPTEHERIEVAEKILGNMPKRPTLHLEDKGDNAFYRPSNDSVTMPKLSFFESEQFYYSVFFHELIHSTKHEIRLNDNTRKSFINGRKDHKKYAFEELIAELGAVFLCAESGILYHTQQNSTLYLKGWASALVSSMKKDNKFFFRASGKAQKGADFILNRDKNEKPAYLKAKKPTTKEPSAAQKKTVKPEQKTNASTKLTLTAKNKTEFEAQLKALGLQIIKVSSKSLHGFGSFKRTYQVNYKDVAGVTIDLEYVKGGETELVINIFGKTIEDYYSDFENVTAFYESVLDQLSEPLKLSVIEANKLREKFSSTLFTKTDKAQLALFGTAKTKATVAFNKAILEAKNKGVNGRKVLTLGRTTDVLKKHVGDAVITIAGATIKKAMQKDKDHIAEWHHFINLPDNLNSPIAIFKSKSKGFVVLTELKNHKNKPLMVALHVNSQFKISNVASIYSKNKLAIYKKWIDDKLDVYLKQKSELSDYKLALIANGSNNSQNKNTKNKPKKQSLGIPVSFNVADELANKTPEPLIVATPSQPTVKENKLESSAASNVFKEVTSEAAPLVNGFKSSAERRKTAKAHQYFNFSGPIADLLGKLEKKPKESLAINISGSKGSMKTRFAFQAVDMFLSHGLNVGFASLEEHAESSVFTDKEDQYIKPQNMQRFYPMSELPETFAEFVSMVKQFDAFFTDSWQKLVEKYGNINFDTDFRKAIDGKILFTIFQETGSGTARGGTKSGHDGDIIFKVQKGDIYQENYVYAEKNRYEKIPGAKYYIHDQKLVTPADEKTKQIPTAFEVSL